MNGGNPFLEKDNIKDAWSESKTYMRPLFEPFDEYERLARNKPFGGIAPHLPKVTEGTLSSTIIKQPRRVIQQIPAGKTIVKDDPALSAAMDYRLTREIIPNARTGGSVLQKAWASTTKALTYGAQPTYSFFTNNGDYYGPDYCLPYVKDVYIEANQLCSGDSNIYFLDHWYTDSQIKAIIDKEKRIIAMAAEVGEDYKPAWDLKLLAKLKDHKSTKDSDSQNATERDKGVQAGGIQILHAFQNGVGAEFFSLAPGMGDTVVRTKENGDRRGKMPINYQFHTVDMTNPLGRGAVEHSGAVQNLLDGMLQSFQYVQALTLAPPMKKWGNGIVASTVKMRPDAVWDMGTDKSSDIEPVNISNQAIQNFPNNFGLVKGIILTGASGSDSSISAESGNTGFSKTNAGVKQQQSILGVDDNYIRKQFEDYQGEVFETLLNIDIAENSASHEMTIDGDELERLVKIIPELAESEGKLNILYGQIDGAVQFQVDASTSAGDDDSEQTEIIANLIDMTQKYPNLLARVEQEGYKFSVGEIVEREIVKSGVQDPEKIIAKMTEEELAQKQIEQEQMLAQEQAAMTAQEPDAQEEAPQEMPAEEDPRISAMRERGLDDEQIQSALSVLASGGSAEDVMATWGLA